MTDFSTLLVNGIPLTVVIFGLVEFVKSFGIQGKALTLVSMGFGLAFGIAYQVAQIGIPVNFAETFSIIVFGLTLGLVTSGFYKFINARLPEAFRG